MERERETENFFTKNNKGKLNVLDLTRNIVLNGVQSVKKDIHNQSQIVKTFVVAVSNDNLFN